MGHSCRGASPGQISRVKELRHPDGESRDGRFFSSQQPQAAAPYSSSSSSEGSRSFCRVAEAFDNLLPLPLATRGSYFLSPPRGRTKVSAADCEEEPSCLRKGGGLGLGRRGRSLFNAAASVATETLRRKDDSSAIGGNVFSTAGNGALVRSPGLQLTRARGEHIARKGGGGERRSGSSRSPSCSSAVLHGKRYSCSSNLLH